MPSGRKPIPSATKRLRGNPGKRTVNHLEPAFEVAIPDMPDVFDGDEDAINEWRRVTQQLAAKQVITDVDLAIVMLYCQNFADWKKHRKALRNEADFLQTDKGYTYPNPRIGLINTLGEKLAKYAAELGITPSSRTKVKMIGKAAAEPSKKQALAEKLFKVPVSK